jgi:hypothetical protein
LTSKRLCQWRGGQLKGQQHRRKTASQSDHRSPIIAIFAKVDHKPNAARATRGSGLGRYETLLSKQSRKG